MLTTPLTDADLAPSLAALDALAACDDFASFCDERRDAWVAAIEAEAGDDSAAEAA